ncbi:MAG: DUF5610 domain-containing protein [Bacterioplanes sp.]|nr:DUF5610 domain-containing protein [Bacterioplanes sp.]
MAILLPPNSLLSPTSSRPTPSVSATASRGLSPEGVAQKQVSGALVQGPRQSAETTAKNILQHVQRGLEQLRSQGANSERLQQRLEAAKQGIEKGYAEAQSMLKGMGLLDDDLQADIDAGRALVDQGLTQLLAPKSSEPSVFTMQSSLRVQNALSLEVMTRDGDRVNVQFIQSVAAQSQQEPGFQRSQVERQQGWQMTVEGELSDAERNALGSLLDDVQRLSDTFFAGNLGQALEQAMALNIDGKQLASMSLSLTQESFVSRSRAYAPQPIELPTPQLQSLKAPLASYVDSYMAALERANPLAEPTKVFADMVQALLPDESRLPVWKAFHQGLNDLLAASTNNGS